MPFLRILIKRYNSGSESTQLDNSYEVKKMDNSYESQPSSGRGSSLSDTQFGAQSDDENANLAPLDHNNQYELNKYFTNDDPQNDNILHGASRFLRKSSQDAIFDGLTESPLTVVDCVNVFPNDNVSPTTIDHILYCQSEVQHKEQHNCCSNQSPLELSFNGKIEKLSDALHKDQTLSQSEAIDSQNLPTLFKNTVDISRTFEPSLFLTKYTNEKSPDLFGDEDDVDPSDDNANYPDDGNSNDDDTGGSGADVGGDSAGAGANTDDDDCADGNNVDSTGPYDGPRCVDSGRAIDDGADCAVDYGVKCADEGANGAVADGSDCDDEGADCVVGDGSDHAVGDGADCDGDEVTYRAVGAGTDRADKGADCTVADVSDCAVDAICAVGDDSHNAVGDGADCDGGEGSYRAVGDGANCADEGADFTVADGSDCAVGDDSHHAVGDVGDGAVCDGGESSYRAVGDGADHAIDDGDDHDINYVSENSKNRGTYPEQEISEADSMLNVQDFRESKDNLGHNGNLVNTQSVSTDTETNFVDEQTMDSSTYCTPINNHRDQLLANYKREKELLKRIRKSLAGVPPPPTVTMPKIDLISAVLQHKESILNFFQNNCSVENGDSCSTDSLFRPTHSLEETQTMAWKDMLGVRQHGLSFNLCKASEHSEYLSLAIIDRFIGAETASSYQQSSPSSVKKRSMRLKMLTASPGSRLSHLARRRTIFSSANLAVNSKKLSSSLGPQILLDKKKCKNRRKGTPKRKTPASKRKNERKTPSSSMRKRLQNRNDFIKFGPSRETSRRALFQSPNKEKSLPKENEDLKESKIILKPDVAKRVEKSKRALFSSESFSMQNTPNTNSTGNEMDIVSLYTSKMHPYSISSEQPSPSSLILENLFKRKRNYADDNDAADFSVEQNNKIFRGNSQILTPRALNIKSQSFCIGAGSSSQINHYNEINPCYPPSVSVRNVANAFSNSPNPISSIGNTTTFKLARAQSENVSVMSNSLTENQRKKLLWAVSQALKEKKITAKHESFKEYAAVLARVVRRIFQEYYQKCSTSNSETMLRLAKKYAFNVITGRTVDDIYFHAKAHIEEKKTRSENRLTGYITSEEYESRKMYLQQKTQKLTETISQSNCGSGSVHNLFTMENSMDSISFGTSQSSTVSVITTGCAIPSKICSSSKIDQRSVEKQEYDSVIKNGAAQQPVNQQEQNNFQQLSIQPNPTLQNSSSKNNICSLALRENIDNEQQRSAQKDFTGKDQRNMSPYIPSHCRGSAIKTHSSVVQDLFGTNIIKAKRQISFDN